MRRGELSAAITQLMPKCLWSGRKWLKEYKEIASPFTCCPVNREYSWKKSQIEKKTKKANYALQHVRTDSRCMWMKSVLNLSWWRFLLDRNRSIDLQNKSVDWFLYDKYLHHEIVNALLLVHQRRSHYRTKQGPKISVSHIRDIGFYRCSQIIRTRNFKTFTVHATIFGQFMAAFHFF